MLTKLSPHVYLIVRRSRCEDNKDVRRRKVPGRPERLCTRTPVHRCRLKIDWLGRVNARGSPPLDFLFPIAGTHHLLPKSVALLRSNENACMQRPIAAYGIVHSSG